MNNSSEVNWDMNTWKEINDAVVAEVFKVRTAQKVFPTMVLDNNPTSISDEVIDFADLSIKEGQTKQFVEIYVQFAMTATQVSKEPQLKTCKTLARMAAKGLALADETVILQGQRGKLPANILADLIESAHDGLLGEADPPDADDNDPNKVSEPIVVNPPDKPKPGLLFGERVFEAVAQGIAKLTAKAQAPNFALFLPVRVYADAFVTPSDASLVTTADRIKPLVEGGFVNAVTLPQNRGLMTALGGNPIMLYVGREATIEYVRKEGSKYFFRVVERVQFVARDPRALVLLKFEPKGAAAKGRP